MGYRSDVKILCQEKAYKMIMDSINEYNKNQTYKFMPCSIQKYNPKYNKEDCLYLLSWYNVKWYDDYEDVQSVMSVLDKLDSKTDKGYGFQYLRIGENHGDIDEKYNDYNEMYGSLYPIQEIGCDIEFDEDIEIKE